MKSSIIWIIVLIVLAAGIFWYMDQPMNQPAEEPESLVVSLSEQNDSGMSGTATLTAMDGRTVVDLDLTGAPEDQVQPAHIHADSCDDIGGVVYPLEFPVNGVSTTTLDVALEDILADLPLAVNVHKSPEEVHIYVACGDLMP